MLGRGAAHRRVRAGRRGAGGVWGEVAAAAGGEADEQQRGARDNPTVGIILCAAKDASIVLYSVLHGNEKLFATRYKLVLPSEGQELIREQRLLEARTERKRRRKR